MNSDKQREYLRYEGRAKLLLTLENAKSKKDWAFGVLGISPIYQAPYIYYEKCICKLIFQDNDVLEIGSGTGLHTYMLVQTGARVVATDISSHSLAVLSQRIREGVMVSAADMEALPFSDNAFDVVASAGSLSYGDPDRVDAEIKRVLRSGGSFICVDSLNHNPIYRFNRWVHYLRGRRTRSTLIRMPTIERIQSISKGFKSAEVRYFGAVSYLMPLFAFIVGQKHAANISDTIDRLLHVRRSAFKFVMVAKGRI